MTLIYVAGPLFSSHERWYLEMIAQELDAAGFSTFLPHRDAGLLDTPSLTLDQKSAIFYSDVHALDDCELCVALLTGADQDSGTSAELGYMYARGKLCFGISDDFRWMNNMIWGICGEGTRLARTVDELIGLIRGALESE